MTAMPPIFHLRLQLSLLARFAAAVMVLATASSAVAETPVDFAAEVLPILSDRCNLCHGPDESSREAELRLDVSDVVGQPTQNGGLELIIAPGDAAASELVRRITSKDEGERMPPSHSKLTLSDQEIATLRRWIDEGAVWQEHWSFRPLEMPAIPSEDQISSAHQSQLPASGSIDRFILSRMPDALSLSPADNRHALLRRLSLDLTGLPPTSEEIAAFVADQRPDAYQRQVDRLLATPEFGEQMAVPWLDAARYADTYGYQSDVYREVWPWRDWVIDAFRQGMPYDQFLLWQLAGDLIPDANRQSRLATAFNRLHRQTNEGGSVEEEFRAEYVSDRVHTLGTAVLGLTLECARCHDHKYDPINQRDYYELAAFFANIDESGLYSHFTSYVPTPVLDLPTDAQAAAIAAAEAKVATTTQAYQQLLADKQGKATAAVTEQAPAIDAGQLLTDEIAHFDFGTLEQSDAESSAEPAPLDNPAATNRIEGGPTGSFSGSPSSVLRAGQPALALDGENGFNTNAGGDWDWYQPFSIGLWMRPAATYERAVVWHRSRAWTDAASCGYELLIEEGCLSTALIHFWPGDAIRVRSTQPLPVDQWSHVTVVWDGSGRASGLRLFVNGEAIETTVVRDKLNRTIRGGGANQLTIGNRFRDRGFKNGQVDDFRIFARDLTDCEVELLATGQTSATTTQLAAAATQAADEEVRTARDQLRAARQQLVAARDAVQAIMTMREEPGLHETHVLRRGQYNAPGERIEQPDVPESLGPLPEAAPRNRLGLARWLVDSRPGHRHPLVARVAVNRLWTMFFDRGLVTTAEDFGLQGDPPSHPQLLDYLACRLIENDWDLKTIIRQIVTSQAYQRSGNCDPATRSQDTDNRWLARGPSARLPIETIRDAGLMAAGLLDRTSGGPPVRPYQPAGLWKEKSGQTYQRQTGAASHRRSLYTIWKRTSPPPAMTLFDVPGREVCVAKRTVTQTPLQALVLLNDEQFVEAARGVAYRLLSKELPTPTENASQLLSELLSRPAAEAEVKAVVQLVDQQQAEFAADPQKAQDYLAIGDFNPFQTPHGDQLAADRLAAWTVAAQTIMNLHEWVTR